MKNFSINVQEPYWGLLLSGKKTIEGRLNKGKFLEIQTGDTITVNEESKFLVVGKRTYKNFLDMIKNEGVKNTIPNAQTIAEAEEVYHQFYNKEQEDEFGVVALELQRL